MQGFFQYKNLLSSYICQNSAPMLTPQNRYILVLEVYTCSCYPLCYLPLLSATKCRTIEHDISAQCCLSQKTIRHRWHIALSEFHSACNLSFISNDLHGGGRDRASPDTQDGDPPGPLFQLLLQGLQPLLAVPQLTGETEVVLLLLRLGRAPPLKGSIAPSVNDTVLGHASPHSKGARRGWHTGGKKELAEAFSDISGRRFKRPTVKE